MAARDRGLIDRRAVCHLAVDFEMKGVRQGFRRFPVGGLILFGAGWHQVQVVPGSSRVHA